MKKHNEHWFVHVSDLHITDPDGDTGFLRKGHYKELIDDLATKLLASISSDRLSGMIFSGDVVNKGVVKDLDHGRCVLEYLRNKLNLEQSQLVCVHGNHDFQWPVVASASYAEAITHVSRIFEGYGSPIPDCQSPLGTLHLLGPNLYVLALDSMLDAPRGSPGDPGSPSTAAFDLVSGMVRDNVGINDILIVVSHHSLSDFNEIPNVAEKLWKAGLPLLTRISKVRRMDGGGTVWLSSDLHIPAKPYPLNLFTCLPGAHLDGGSTQTIQKPGVVLFSLKTGSPAGRSCVVELVQAAHAARPSGGEWQLREAYRFASSSNDEVRISADLSTQNVAKKHSVSQKAKGVHCDLQVELFEDAITTVTGGSETLEKRIIAKVAREKLYHFDRFETSDEFVSLGWVSIGPLMSGTLQLSDGDSASPPLLPQIITQMRDWLSIKCNEFRISASPASVVVLGVDSWGAVMSSQISIMTGWRNFCLAGRGKGVHHTNFERVTPRVLREIAEATLVVIVTDVIASGSTVAYIYSEIVQKLAATGAKKVRRRKWVAASILCDERTKRISKLEFLSSIGCACRRLRIPQIPAEYLPDIQVLPARLRFTNL